MSPYAKLPARAFWRTGVAEQNPLTVTDLYRKKFAINPTDKIATAGSCFAQHIATHLKRAGYPVLDVEPAPFGMTDETAKTFGYNLYSARYANIYVVRQLLQLVREARGGLAPAEAVWTKDGRYYDALRPSVEPNGLDTAEEVALHRAHHLKRVRNLFSQADLLVFTFGLTESWVHRETGTVYPTAPGAIAGEFDPAVYEFKNFTFGEIYQDFVALRALLKRNRPDLKFLITVSPVPLTATAGGEHVLTATTYSKSVLRAVAGQLYADFDDVDYFPSYEMVATPFSRGFFYENNLRSVHQGGVEAVMRVFFSQHALEQAAPAPAAAPVMGKDPPRGGVEAQKAKDDVVCEDALLEAFAP